MSADRKNTDVEIDVSALLASPLCASSWNRILERSDNVHKVKYNRFLIDSLFFYILSRIRSLPYIYKISFD